MNADQRFVPKVHPAKRDVEADDPMELVATLAVGDPDVMLECMVQEFAGMGWGEEQLMELFHNPSYPVLAQLRDWFGEDEVRRRLRDILARQGAFRVRATIDEAPDPDEEIDPELIQVTVRQRD